MIELSAAYPITRTRVTPPETPLWVSLRLMGWKLFPVASWMVSASSTAPRGYRALLKYSKLVLNGPVPPVKVSVVASSSVRPSSDSIAQRPVRASGSRFSAGAKSRSVKRLQRMVVFFLPGMWIRNARNSRGGRIYTDESARRVQTKYCQSAPRPRKRFQAGEAGRAGGGVSRDRSPGDGPLDESLIDGFGRRGNDSAWQVNRRVPLGGGRASVRLGDSRSVDLLP